VRDNLRSPGGDRQQPREHRDNEGRLEWKPKGAAKSADAHRAGRKPDWKSRDARPKGKPEWKPRGERLDWKPRGEAESAPRPKSHDARPKPAAGRDRNWRPGGDHKDPRQKYKDAKKAKWQRFKKNIRSRWDAKQGPGKKRRDEES
jgi:hypothetical protein